MVVMLNSHNDSERDKDVQKSIEWYLKKTRSKDSKSSLEPSNESWAIDKLIRIIIMEKKVPYLTAIIESHNHLTTEELIELIKKLNEERRIDYCMALIEILMRRKVPLTK